MIVDYVKNIVPLWMKKCIKISKARWHFRRLNCQIDSAYVSCKAILGSNVKIAENCVIDPNCKVGRYTYMQMGTNISNAELGAFCSIGNNVSIGTRRHAYNWISTSPKLFNSVLGGVESYPSLIKVTKIGSDVWIGSNSVILDGVVVGDGVVIGAGSIVTKDVPPYAIVVGNPAYILKYRFSRNTIEKLEQEQWFNWDDETIRKKAKCFIGEINE